MAIKKQFSVCLENKPGQLARLCGALARGKVNITALSVVENTDCGQVRFLADSVPAARRALKKAKLSAVESDVVMAVLPNDPGVLAQISTTLAKAGVNINYVYGSTNPAADDALCVFAVDNPKKAAKLLG